MYLVLVKFQLIMFWLHAHSHISDVAASSFVDLRTLLLASAQLHNLVACIPTKTTFRVHCHEARYLSVKPV